LFENNETQNSKEQTETNSDLVKEYLCPQLKLEFIKNCSLALNKLI
jgi:hypothetical protein